ncbi:hypothetical protein [Clostridium beijerinckii]|uniref:hypothetical protein n=1 Tax=Clostridium beijerinckii TaxID=1520 RepID=UPI0014946E40|nr:hypothetical protein [Clostridium beijerinckii]NOW34207.1 hypothetical protein [Clostridium beijerinckii]
MKKKKGEDKDTLNLEQSPLNLKQIDANAIRSEAIKEVALKIRKARNNAWFK